MPTFLLMIPQFGFCRVMYLLSVSCATTSCIESLSGLSSEIYIPIIFMFVWSIVLFLLGVSAVFIMACATIISFIGRYFLNTNLHKKVAIARMVRTTKQTMTK